MDKICELQLEKFDDQTREREREIEASHQLPLKVAPQATVSKVTDAEDISKNVILYGVNEVDNEKIRQKWRKCCSSVIEKNKKTTYKKGGFIRIHLPRRTVEERRAHIKLF